MFLHRKRVFLSVYVDDIKLAGKKQNLAPMWRKLMKKRGLGEPTSFLDHVYLGCTRRECKPNEAIKEQYTRMFESRISAGATEKLLGWQKPLAQTKAFSCDMEGHDTVMWQTRKWNNFTKFRILVWMIINSNRRNWNQLENCQKFARKLSWNACTWQELDDLTSCGQWTSSQDDQSQNGLKHVTNDYQGWLPIFITQMTIVNVVMWETQHNTADLGYFKTQTLQATLRTQSQAQEVSCVFLEVELLSQSVGCARDKHRFRTVLQNLKLFLGRWTTYGWCYVLSIFGTVVIEVLRTTKDNSQPNHTSTRKLEADQPNHTSSRELPAVQPNWWVCDSKT